MVPVLPLDFRYNDKGLTAALFSSEWLYRYLLEQGVITLNDSPGEHFQVFDPVFSSPAPLQRCNGWPLHYSSVEVSR